MRVIKGGDENTDQGTGMHRKVARNYAFFIDTNFEVWNPCLSGKREGGKNPPQFFC